LALEHVASRPAFAGRTEASGSASTLRHGQILNATVSARGPGDAARLSGPWGALETRLPEHLETGATVRIQVLRNGRSLAVLLLGEASPAATAGSGRSGPSAALLSGVLQEAASRQNSAAPLFANLAALSGQPDVDLPTDVRGLIGQLAAFRLVPDQSLDGEALRTALLNSGLLYESGLARGAATPPGPGGDIKGLLLALQGALRAWLGPAVAPRPGGERLPPPVKGAGPPVPAGTAPPPDLGALAGEDAGRLLMTQTEAALARLRLVQAASLPEDTDASAGGERTHREWTFELPFALGERTLMVQFKLARERASSSRRKEDGWVLRFSLDAGPLGPVHGSVSLRDGRIAVTLWAESKDGRRRLGGNLSALKKSLGEGLMDLAEIKVVAGRPGTRAPATGTVVDRAT